MWQPIETAPRDGTRILAYQIFSETKPVLVVHRHDPGGAERNPRHNYDTWVSDWNTPVGEITHWMPLPEPPTAMSDVEEIEALNAEIETVRSAATQGK
jgi:hypothetical protein